MAQIVDYAGIVLHCSQACVALYIAVERLAAPSSKDSWLYSVATIYGACESWRKSVDVVELALLNTTKQRAVSQTIERLSVNLKRAIDTCTKTSSRTGILSRSNDSKDDIDSDSSFASESDWPTSVSMSPELATHWRRMLSDMLILRQQLQWLPRVPFQPISRSRETLNPLIDLDDAEDANADETVVRLYLELSRQSVATSVTVVAASTSVERIQDAAMSARLVHALRCRRMLIKKAAKKHGSKTLGPGANATKELIQNLANNPKASLPIPSRFSVDSSYKCHFCDQKNVKWRKEEKSYRHHLLRHLRPYSCTYASCTSPDELYDSLDSWTEHEEHVEQLKWVCPYCRGQEDASFVEKDDFERHLRDSHGEHVDEESVQLLLNYARQVRPTAPRHCGLCRRSTSSIDGDLRTHLHGHFEQLSMLALYNCGNDILASQRQAISRPNQQSTTTAKSTSLQSNPKSRIALDPELITQSAGYARRNRSFFVPGRVIQIRKYRESQGKYDSAYGSASSHAASISGDKKGEDRSDRDSGKWFLIIRNDHDVSHCLLITTNNGRGVSQSEKKSIYSPVRSGAQKVQILDSEHPTLPLDDEMQDEISVTPTRASHPLPPLARILWTSVHSISYDCEAQLCAIVTPRTEFLVMDIYKEMNPGGWDLEIPKRQ